MPSVNRNLLYLLVAVVLGVAASLLAVRYVNEQVASRTHVTSPETRQVVVPVHDLEKGTTLSSNDVAVRDVPVDFVPTGALTPENYQKYLGQVLRAPLTHGAPIDGSVIDLVSEHFSNVIEPGHVAYTVQVDETNSVSGLIVPGDHIDLLLLTTQSEQERIRPLLGRVLVLATGQQAKGVRSETTNNKSFSNITLELAPADAQRVGMALKVGELRVMLRNADSREPFELGMLTRADLLRLGRPVRAGAGIEFIIGGKG